MLGLRLSPARAAQEALFRYFETQRNLAVAIKATGQERRIRRLQLKGEILALAALAPYYVGSIGQHILEQLSKIYPKSETTYSEVLIGWWFAILTFCLAATIPSVLEYARDYKNKARPLFAIILIVAFTMVVLTLAMVVFDLR